MTRKDRILIVLSSYVWATLILFFLGSLIGFSLVVISLIYLFIGGRKHV
jgi:hypothetical protein